jgi:hypothetical protein
VPPRRPGKLPGGHGRRGGAPAGAELRPHREDFPQAGRPDLPRVTDAGLEHCKGLTGLAYLDLIGQRANEADDTMPAEYGPSDRNIVCRYANGVRLVLDFLKAPFKDRSRQYLTRLGTCPVRFEGVEGWAETGDEGEVVVRPASLAGGLPEQAKRVRGLGVTAHARNFFDCSARARRRPPTPT